MPSLSTSESFRPSARGPLGSEALFVGALLAVTGGAWVATGVRMAGEPDHPLRQKLALHAASCRP